MNTTELKARKWLAAERNLKESEIVYSSTSTPDFRLPDGSMYEVKLLYGDKLILFPTQLNIFVLLPEIQILAFRREGEEPVFTIPAREVTEILEAGHDHWHHLKLVVYGSPLRIFLPSDIWKVLKDYCDSVSSEELRLVKGRRNSLGVNVNDVAMLAIVEFLERRGLLKENTWSTEDLTRPGIAKYRNNQ